MGNSIYDIPLKSIDDQATTLAKYQGEVLLLVNVASKCGLTPQYAGLQKLYEQKHEAGLEVLGFPANDFMGQEPGSEADIASFCSTQYDVDFPLFAKISVVGPQQHALYKQLTAAVPQAEGGDGMRKSLVGYGITPNPEPEVLWNFEKFLLARDGSVVGRFAPDVTADDPRLLAALERELAKTG